MPGRHNSSSIEGGIFNSEAVQMGAPPPRTSAPGGIFNGPAEALPPPPPRTSQVGGIFAPPTAVEQSVAPRAPTSNVFSDAPAQPDTARRSAMTKSSIDGGIFGGYDHVEAPVVRAPPTPRDSSAVAGAPMPKKESFSLFDAGAKPTEPLAPCLSARSNPNASSIAGGIFNPTPVTHKAPIERKNPNASSIPGGIFG